MNSVSTFWHGVKVDRPPEVMPVRRACVYVERRSGLLDVAYRCGGPERRAVQNVEVRLAVHVKRLAVHGKGRPDGLQHRAVQNVVPRMHMRAELA